MRAIFSAGGSAGQCHCIGMIIKLPKSLKEGAPEARGGRSVSVGEGAHHKHRQDHRAPKSPKERASEAN